MAGSPNLPNRPAEMADKLDDMVIAPPRPNASPFAAAQTDSPSSVGEVASRLTALPGGLVDGGEVIILAVKPSMWRPFFDSAAWLVTLSALAVATTVWKLVLPGLSVSASAQLILMLALVRLCLAVILWVPTWYVLTNRRLIEIQGLRTPHIGSCPLLEVRNTYVRASAAERATHLGTITYVTSDDRCPPRCWRTIAQAEAVHTEIRRAIENAIDNQHLA